MRHEISRREFLAVTATAAGTLLLPRHAFAAIAPREEPRFFLQIFLQGGADPTYLFDARPHSLTAAGKLQNYNAAAPVPHLGTNGVGCLAAESASGLLPFLDRINVVNGVIMSPSFDGHVQNIDYFFTGSAFGGESFLPQLNLDGRAPLDSVQNGAFFGDVTNHGNVVPLDPASLSLLQAKLAASPDFGEGSELFGFARSRFAVNAAGEGLFSRASQRMLDGLMGLNPLRSKLAALGKPDPAKDPEEQFVAMLGSLFQNGVTRSALWVLTPPGVIFDAHDPLSAKQQPKNFATTAGKIATIFRSLAATPFDDRRSLFDVTTVVVNSEFGRTMRQESRPVDATGTDHDPLHNSFLIGGGGIRGGRVFGATDFESPHEKLSPAHYVLDPKGIKMMGRPFDFGTQRPRQDLPVTFEAASYLTAGSVVNTLLSRFGVPRAKWRTLDRNGTLAPVIAGLLT